eukprot:162955-Chlamydomonas_euryale.AAC.1
MDVAADESENGNVLRELKCVRARKNGCLLPVADSQMHRSQSLNLCVLIRAALYRPSCYQLL